MHRLITSLLGAALAATLPAQTVSFTVEMTGAEESPPTATGGIGTATLTANLMTGAVTVAGNYLNLSSAAGSAHLHGSARRGANGNILVVLGVSGGTTGTISGGGTLSASGLTALRDGLTYLNVHTGVLPLGEIRGQVDTVPGSGSPGAPAASISGAATSGGTLSIGSPPSINTPFLLVGVPLAFGATLPLPPSIACVPSTNLGFNVGAPFFALPGGSASLAIPAAMPNTHIAIQVGFIGFTPCIDLSAASRIAIRTP